jgi:hypothetical protein
MHHGGRDRVEGWGEGGVGLGLGLGLGAVRAAGYIRAPPRAPRPSSPRSRWFCREPQCVRDSTYGKGAFIRASSRRRASSRARPDRPPGPSTAGTGWRGGWGEGGVGLGLGLGLGAVRAAGYIRAPCPAPRAPRPSSPRSRWCLNAYVTARTEKAHSLNPVSRPCRS